MFNLIKQFVVKNIGKVLPKIFTPKNFETIVNKTEEVIEKNEEKLFRKVYKKEPKWQVIFPFSFFYHRGRFQPIFFWVTVFCGLASFMLFTKTFAAWKAIKANIFTVDMISTADLGVVLGFISSLILLYNSNKNRNKPSIATSFSQEKLNQEGKQI
jgi:hypothetical protein